MPSTRAPARAWAGSWAHELAGCQGGCTLAEARVKSSYSSMRSTDVHVK
jgi:hypothetical protein